MGFGGISPAVIVACTRSHGRVRRGGGGGENGGDGVDPVLFVLMLVSLCMFFVVVALILAHSTKATLRKPEQRNASIGRKAPIEPWKENAK